VSSNHIFKPSQQCVRACVCYVCVLLARVGVGEGCWMLGGGEVCLNRCIKATFQVYMALFLG